MNAFDQAALLVALLAGGVVLYFIFQSPHTFSIIPTSTLIVEGPSSVFAGDSFSIHITATQAEGALLRVNSSPEQTYNCTTSICTFSPVFLFDEEEAGKHTFLISAGTQTKEWTVHIVPKKSICIDSTVEGECSRTLPLRCVNQKLISDCGTCSCPQGEACLENICTKMQPIVSISLAPISTPAYTTSKTNITASILNEGNFSLTELYVIRLAWYDAGQKEIGYAFQQVSIDTLPEGKSSTHSFSIVLPKSAVLLRATFFPIGVVYDSTTQLGESNSISVLVQEDVSSPLPPEQLTYHALENGYLLTWNASPSPDVALYRVYQQTLATGGFTSYTTLLETSSTNSEIVLPGIGDWAYTIVALDYAGNASPATSPIVISSP
ncbi:MAG: hypothetical protein V1776_00090 [Candidatus Diapherotrites archaeon]